MSLKELDKQFARLVKERSSWSCEKCKRPFVRGAQNLHASHFIGRRNKALRYDLDNVHAHCSVCHDEFTKNPFKHREWVYDYLGADLFYKLTQRKQDVKKTNDSYKQDVKEMIKEEMKKIEEIDTLR